MAASKAPERTYPIGGDPKDFCICGHHEMNHANHAGWNRACNQTFCPCRKFQYDSAALNEANLDTKEGTGK